MKTRISLIAFTAVISIVFASPSIFAEDVAVQKGKENTMPVQLQWFGHASFKISSGSDVIYIDPWKLKNAPHDATIVLVSHSHYDHYSAEDIAKVSGTTTKFIAAADVVQKQGKGQTLKPGQSIDINGIKITGVPAYNITKQFHPKSNNWLGFVIEIAGKRIYYAGDTDAHRRNEGPQKYRPCLAAGRGQIYYECRRGRRRDKTIQTQTGNTISLGRYRRQLRLTPTISKNWPPVKLQSSNPANPLQSISDCQSAADVQGIVALSCRR